MNTDLHMAHLLCTRICHDLAGPVGAVSAGVELMGSDPSLIDEETLSLLSNSAGAASGKLKFLRIAFGWAGSGMPPFDQIGDAFTDYLQAVAGPSGGPAVIWPQSETFAPLAEHLGDQAAQVIANMVLAGLEVNPRCQSLSVSAGQDGQERYVSVTNGSGGDIRPREDLLAAMEGRGADTLSPHTVQAHLTHHLVAANAGVLTVEVVSDQIISTARWHLA